MHFPKYDIIPDIHGQHDKLVRLLAQLGYQRTGGTHRHPEGRKIIFLGDFIDRGPKILEVLETVKGMTDAGDALAVMGNHEFNAVCFATEDGKGGHLREHSERNIAQHAATLAAFKATSDWQGEWRRWVDWFKKLPFFLDLGALRIIHACWDPAAIGILKISSMDDPQFLKMAAAEENNIETENGQMTPFRAIETCLKGPELTVDEGFLDKDGELRHQMRVRWWGLKVGMTFGQACMPVPCGHPQLLMEHHLRRIPQYGPAEPPVFFGHYWLPETSEPRPLCNNIVCLDYSAGIGGPLVACRFDAPKPADWTFVTTD
jgi:hypothetical protein